jgi:hypothetical protein
MNDAQIQAVAEKILRPALGNYGYERAEVRSGNDFSDEPAIYVDAVLGKGAPDLGPGVLMNAHYALSEALLAEGEERFPYLGTKRLNDDDRPEEAVLKPSRGRM